MNIEKVINDNRSKIADAICEHNANYAHNLDLYELHLLVDEAGNVSFESAIGNSGTEFVFDDYYVIFKCGGHPKKAWSIIGDAIICLKGNEMLDVLEDVAETLDVDVDEVTEEDVEAYIEDNHPDWIDEWLERTHNDSYDDEVAYAYECIDEFLEKLECYLEENED
ncbi:hypothetical protein [Ruminococcus flavefaciens]|uniref:hypothetical protein n=1 Tax=Ruminococcus flavefaciens TaxID=1265 RepID=UPI0026EA6877|nr:hypothetical protein [Ruminococcus flavefaciens]